MSFLSDMIANTYDKYLGGASKWCHLLFDSEYHSNGDPITNAIDEELSKKDLRGAEIEQLLGGVPVVGDILRGIEGVNQLEDLYAKTGKIPAYPLSPNTSSLTSGLGQAVKNIGKATKIDDGVNDLYHYYAGEQDGWWTYVTESKKGTTINHYKHEKR